MSAAEIRAWAAREGWDVPSRGKVPRHVVEAYVAAGGVLAETAPLPVIEVARRMYEVTIHVPGASSDDEDELCSAGDRQGHRKGPHRRGARPGWAPVSEPLRMCTRCGHTAFRFRPCHLCALFAKKSTIGLGMPHEYDH